MTVLSHQSIRAANIFTPFHDRSIHEETLLTYGCGAASYDVRLSDDVHLTEGLVTLASTLEHFTMPDDVCGVVHDKSSLARKGVLVQNTFIDPGWHGFLTLEISYHGMQRWRRLISFLLAGLFRESMCLRSGTPIAQIVLHRLDEPSEHPYKGRYQDQEKGPQASRTSL